MKPSTNSKANIKNRVTSAAAALTIAGGIGGAAIASSSSYPKPGEGSPKPGEIGPEASGPSGPYPADRSPGTPDPEDSHVPTAGSGPNQPPTNPDGGSTNTPAEFTPGAAESMKLIPAQPPKLAFTGPMEITASPFAGDQITAGHPAEVVGQGGPVSSESLPTPAPEIH